MDEDDDEEQLDEQPEDPNAARRFWFEHATGAGKTVAALGFVEASRTGGVLILTHRRNLVDQFNGELRDRGYSRPDQPRRCSSGEDAANGPVTVETYQWFVRNAGKISDAYTIVICDEAHTALGEKTSAAIRAWSGPIFIGMTATGALIARHVTDLFPTQTSRFDLAQAARRGVIAPLRCIRIPPGPGVRTIAKVPLRRGEVDTEFDQEMLAELLDQTPFNMAIADLYKTRFNGVPGVVYAAGVRHAYNVAEAFRDDGDEGAGRSPARRPSASWRGSSPTTSRARSTCSSTPSCSPRAGTARARRSACTSRRPRPSASTSSASGASPAATRARRRGSSSTSSTRRPSTTTRSSRCIRCSTATSTAAARSSSARCAAAAGRRVRVERRVLPVTPDPERRAEVFERELWRIAVEHLDYGEQHVWAALAGARVAPNGWRRAQGDAPLRPRRRAQAPLPADRGAAQPQLAAAPAGAAGDRRARATPRRSTPRSTSWPAGRATSAARASKIMLQALAERRIGRRDQANAWIWRMAEYTREVHEEYAVQRWPETKRLLGLLVNSSGAAHARNARRLVHAARKEDRRLSAALLAAALAHTPEAEEALRGARTRMARKPAALARELLRNFPKGRRGKRGAGAGGLRALGASAGSNGARANAGNSNQLDDTRGETNGADGVNRSGASENLNGARGTAGAGGDVGRPPRAPRSRRRKARSQTPSDAVLTEALSSAPASARDNGGELAPGAGEKLQRNVEEALDHAEE